MIFIHHPSKEIGVDGEPWLHESPSKNKAVGFDEGVGQESASLGRTALTQCCFNAGLSFFATCGSKCGLCMGFLTPCLRKQRRQEGGEVESVGEGWDFPALPL